MHVGMKSSKTSQTRCERHHNTFTPSLHLMPFCQLCTPKNFYMHLAYSHPLNEHGTQHCSLHSFSHKRQSISAMFSSNKILQHNLRLPTYHADPVLLTVLHTRQTKAAMPSSNYIAATHTLHGHQHVLHTHYYPPNAFHNPPHCLPQPSYAHN